MCDDTVFRLINGEMVDKVTRLPNKSFVEKIKERYPDMKVIKIHTEIGKTDGLKDIIISKVSSVIKHSIRLPKDMVARTGEKEFVVILGQVDDGTLKIVADRIKENLGYFNVNVGGKTIKIIPVVEILPIKEV